MQCVLLVCASAEAQPEGTVNIHRADLSELFVNDEEHNVHCGDHTVLALLHATALDAGRRTVRIELVDADGRTVGQSSFSSVIEFPRQSGKLHVVFERRGVKMSPGIFEYRLSIDNFALATAPIRVGVPAPQVS